jgi:ribokinase
MNPRILSLGSVNVDFQLRTERWPEPGETLLGRDFLMAGGGKAANVAWLARRLGVESQLIAHTGSDALQEIALHSLRNIGVDLSTVRSLECQSTGISMIMVQQDGRKGIILASNSNDIWTKKDEEMVSEALKTAPPGSLLTANLEIPVSIVKHAVRHAHECGIPVILDPSPAERMDQELLESGSYFTPNQSEAQQLTKISITSFEEALEAAHRLHAFGNMGICVKLGKGGCAVVTAGMHCVISAPKVRTIDTTGAGDAFAGALSTALLQKQSLSQAARFAVAAAAHAVTGYGSQSSYPTRSQIEILLPLVTIKE